MQLIHYPKIELIYNCIHKYTYVYIHTQNIILYVFNTYRLTLQLTEQTSLKATQEYIWQRWSEMKEATVNKNGKSIGKCKYELKND